MRCFSVVRVYDTGASSDNSSVPGRQVSSDVDDYNYEYEYETAMDDEAMFDVEQLDIEYVDEIELTADKLDPQMKLELDKTRHGTRSHRRRRPHARYIV